MNPQESEHTPLFWSLQPGCSLQSEQESLENQPLLLRAEVCEFTHNHLESQTNYLNKGIAF